MLTTLLLTPEASYADGNMTPRRPVVPGPEFGELLDRAAGRLVDDGVLLLTADMAERVGLGRTPARELEDAARTAHPACASARAHGWKVGALSAWTTFQGPSGALHVGVFDWMERDDLPVPVTSPVEASVHLHAWRCSLGVPWAGTAGVAGVTLARHVAHGPHVPELGRFARPRWVLPENQAKPEWSHAATFRGLSWRAPARPDPKPYQHTYDVNRQWLTAAGQTLLATDMLTHTGRIEYSPRRAGMWLVRFEYWHLEDLLPDPAGPRAAASRDGAAVWVSTPRLGLVHELAQREDRYAHMGYEIIDSWTAPGYLVLKPWADELKKVLADPDFGPAAKLVYAKTMTTISRPRPRMYRPDWAASVVDMGQVNLWRHLLKIGAAGGGWPVHIKADQPTYESDFENWADDIPAGMPVSDQFGKFKHRETTQLEVA